MHAVIFEREVTISAGVSAFLIHSLSALGVMKGILYTLQTDLHYTSNRQTDTLTSRLIFP